MPNEGVSVDKQQHTAARAGFTLVELSIVLVIIALLVGGIAGLRTYTRNAAITSVMNEGKIFITAFNQFQTRYNAPPGDYPAANAAWTAAANGDGNGLVRATSVAGTGNRDELFFTFEHLALAGFISGTYTGATVGGVGTYHARIGTNVPATSMEKVAFLFDHPDYDDGTPDGFIVDATDAHPLFFEGQYPNSLRIAALYDADTDIPARGFITPKQALQLDEKYDDGRPGTGMVVAPKSSGVTDCADNDTASSAVYETDKDAKTCWVLVKIQ
jgi:prepilin-type N-terminal cleavage/methylation domain-containing protein